MATWRPITSASAASTTSISSVRPTRCDATGGTAAGFLPKFVRDAGLVNGSLMVFAAAFLGITQLLRVIYLLRLGAGLG